VRKNANDAIILNLSRSYVRGIAMRDALTTRAGKHSQILTKDRGGAIHKRVTVKAVQDNPLSERRDLTILHFAPS
jgi:hypothetical protein